MAFVVVAANVYDMENLPDYDVAKVRAGFPDRDAAEAHADCLNDIHGYMWHHYVLAEDEARDVCVA